MMNKSIAIITPVYNRLNTLEWTCKSVRKQQYPYCHILVDDGSTDGSQELIKRLAQEDKDIVALFRERNTGDKYTSSNALNTGFIHALQSTNCYYFTRLDSDDLLSPDSLLARMSHFTEKVGVVYAKEYGFTSTTVFPSRGKIAGDASVTARNAFHRGFPFHTMIMNRRCLEQMEIFYDPLLDYHEDLDFTLRLIDKVYELGLSFVFCDKEVVYMRGHADSISSRISLQKAIFTTLSVWWLRRQELGLFSLYGIFCNIIFKYRVIHPLLNNIKKVMSHIFSAEISGSHMIDDDVLQIPSSLRWFDEKHE